MHPIKIVLIEDDLSSYETAQLILKHEYKIDIELCSMEDAKKHHTSPGADLFIVDLNNEASKLQGSDIAKRLRHEFRSSRIVLYTRFANPGGTDKGGADVVEECEHFVDEVIPKTPDPAAVSSRAGDNEATAELGGAGEHGEKTLWFIDNVIKQREQCLALEPFDLDTVHAFPSRVPPGLKPHLERSFARRPSEGGRRAFARRGAVTALDTADVRVVYESAKVLKVNVQIPGVVAGWHCVEIKLGGKPALLDDRKGLSIENAWATTFVRRPAYFHALVPHRFDDNAYPSVEKTPKGKNTLTYASDFPRVQIHTEKPWP